ncbi:MAG TPA: hypothetical protein VEC93_18095 [Anaerolineae bacterium]|nr:hypothetical protein [Anaerolineae bacterium]
MRQSNLNTSILAGWFFPLPPLAEQKRIVAKVEGLLRQCDALKAALVAGEAARVKVLESMLWHGVNGRGMEHGWHGSYG